MTLDMVLQGAEVMARRALEHKDNKAAAERRKVARLIVDASNNGALTVTFYDPISDVLVRELGEMGYQVNARSHAGPNETEWNVTISWDKPYGRTEDRVNSMPRRD